MKNIEKIKPSGIFTNYIYKAIPLAFDESMSYYETLCGVLNLLKDQEIIVNNNADALIELQDYVTHYFDNLDVQEEINNKLDEMAESGKLEEIISEYLNSLAIFGFDTISDMKASTNLKNGSYAKTTGKDSFNDGLGGFYKIRSVTNDDVIDNYNIVPMNDNTLVAERIINNIETNVVKLNTDIKNKINKFIPNFITNNDNYYIRVGTKQGDIHYLQFSIDLIKWDTICDLPSDIFMQPTSYKNNYDMNCFIYNNEFYILYDYVDENYNNWSDLNPDLFRFANRIGVTKTSDFITWTKYPLETPLEYKQIANPRILFDNDEIYLCLVGNDGTLKSETAYYHFPLICKLNSDITRTSNYTKLINSSENIIDPYIYKDNDTYYLFVANETPSRSMQVYKNTVLTTQFTTLVDTITYNWNVSKPITIEGASLIKKDNLYYLIMDSVDHRNVVNITSNIESWNNCQFLLSDNMMGNASIYSIDTDTKKNIMKLFYEVNDYPMFDKFPTIKLNYKDYINQSKQSFELFLLPNKTIIVYSGTWNLTINKTLLPYDNKEFTTIINDSGSSNNCKLINLYGNNTSWFLPLSENVNITKTNILSNGNNYYWRAGHEALSNIVADTVKKFTLAIPGTTYSKVKSIQVTPFTIGTNTKKINCYVDTVSTDSITISVLSNENISSMEVYWLVYFQ